MRTVLYLGPISPLVEYLWEDSEVWTAAYPIAPARVNTLRPDWIVSYNYRHLIPRSVLELAPAVNLHVSYLPWNRGAHPNLWSVLDGTPTGASIHLIDERIDTGDLIAQERVETSPDDTLASSYVRLHAQIQRLFRDVWPRLARGEITVTPQPPGGSYHRAADLERVRHLLTDGWDTPIRTVLANRDESARRRT